MEVLRTPDERFADLPEYPFAPRYVDVPSGTDRTPDAAALRVHYLDEGPPGAPIVLLLHGEPSWSFLYRRMIPVITAAGLRAVAIDLVGFGRSDKPGDRADYTYQRHVDWTWAAIEAIGLDAITLVAQDWGGLIGLRLVGEHPDRFARAVAANTFLPTGDRDPGEAFFAWQKFSQETPEFPVGNIVNAGCTTQLSPEVIAAYDAPFPDESYKEGARQFPLLVPSRPDDPASDANRRAWEGLRTFTRPFLCAFSDHDPITKGADRQILAEIPGCAGQPHTTIEGGGHFLQEDRGPELARVVVDFVAATAGGDPG
jgi:haloalkane dehalogenase